MKQKNVAFAATSLLAVAVLFQVSCGSQAEPAKPTVLAEKKELTQAELISRGKYLVTIGGCHDCHTSKKFGPQGPSLDEEHLLAGHLAGSPLPPFDAKSLQPGGWLSFNSAVTAYVGPWGISYAANLTPDSTTGIGAWSEETFVKTIRTGKHLGLEGGRPILPPMPWQGVAQMTDEDIKAVYTFLRAVPAVKNQVPAPVNPIDAAKLAR